MRARRTRGFTLIELMVGVTMAGILALVAVPSLSEVLARMRLEGATAALGTDLQYARSEALRRRAPVTLASNNDGSAYAITSSFNGVTTTLKTVTLSHGLALGSNAFVTFDAMRAMANVAQLNTTSPGTAAALRLRVNGVGRVQVCSPSGSFAGYTAC